MREFRSVGDAFVSLTGVLRGTTPFLWTLTTGSNMPLASLFVVAFVSSLFLSGLGLAAATLNDAYRFVRRKLRYNNASCEDARRDHEMIDFLMKQFKKWLGITKPKPV